MINRENVEWLVKHYAGRRLPFDMLVIFKTPSGYVQQVPQVSIAQQNLKIMQSFATEFGLTPACRARIVASGGAAESDDDPMAQLLKGGWQDDV